MDFLSEKQITKIDLWMSQNGRKLDLAKWQYLFANGSKEEIVDEMLKYQNEDGGFGNGFEADILLPLSAAIPSAEAIFLAYDFDLDCSGEWFVKLLHYFENTIQMTPSFWEPIPQSIEEYDHAPWWQYQPDTKFSPNPCGVIASALIKYGNQAQREIGNRVAEACFDFLLNSEHCGYHDCYNLMKLIEILQTTKSPLITEQIISVMKKRISDDVCYDEAKWHEYFSQPLDFADNPDSEWYPCVKEGIAKNFDYWLKNSDNEGVWTPNFSWGVDSDISRQVTENWKGHMAVKRARIFKNYDLIQM